MSIFEKKKCGLDAADKNDMPKSQASNNPI